MLKDSPVFSSYSTNDVDASKQFYGETLGLTTKKDDKMGMLTLTFPGGNEVIIYPKDDHQPATYTVLNFVVKDIDQAVDELSAKGIVFEHYDNMTDEKGVARGLSKSMGPDIAWFKDPAGNILSVLQKD